MIHPIAVIDERPKKRRCHYASQEAQDHQEGQQEEEHEEEGHQEESNSQEESVSVF